MRRHPIRFFGLAFFSCGLALLGVWFFVLTTPESRAVGSLAREWHSLLDPGAADRAKTIAAEVKFVRTAGLPDALEGQSAEFLYRYPDKILLHTEVEGEEYRIARDGQEVWLHVPGKDMAILGTGDTPRFSNDPSSVAPVELADFALPFDHFHLALLPALIDAHESPPDGPGNRSVRFVHRVCDRGAQTSAPPVSDHLRPGNPFPEDAGDPWRRRVRHRHRVHPVGDPK
jgi:hypothetical protein